MSYTILIGDPRYVGSGNPPVDMNNANDVLAGNSRIIYNVLNTAYGAGADRTGSTDATSAINDTLAEGAGAENYLPAGTYLLNSSSALALAVAGTWLVGDGPGATILKIGASFAASEAIAITASYCGVRDLSIIGASSTITSNPACNGVEITGCQHCQLERIYAQYVNGWAIESVGGSSTANLDTMLSRITGRNCAAGIHIQGVTGSAFGGEHFLTDIQLQQIGAASGSSENLDAFKIEDCSDILVENFNGSVSDVSTGSTLHIKGDCSSIFVDTFDLGVSPNGSPNNSVLLIEDSGNGSPSGVHLDGGILQQGLVGATISGGATRVYFDGVDIANNSTHGCVLSGTGSGIYFEAGTTFRGNGAGASGTNYDLNVSGSATGKVTGAHFLSTVTGAGTAGVQTVANIASSGQNIPFLNCDFVGTGAGFSTIFTNQPAYVRGCKGYNPHGSVSVTVPGSGTAVATALHYDAYYYITAGTTSCSIVRNTNGAGGGGGPTITIPANTMVPVFIPAGGNFTPTYVAAPTWVVDGN